MGRDPRYDILFEPVRIGPLTVRNRFYHWRERAGVRGCRYTLGHSTSGWSVAGSPSISRAARWPA